MKTLTKIPTLKVVADDVAAKKLRELLKDADDGFRRVVKVGLYIEWIAANLDHGQFMPWLEAHAPDVSQRSIYNWRSLAKNLCEWGGLKFASLANLPMSADKLLDWPVKDLSPALQKVRAKMDEALGESHSAKQLFLHLGFKQSEIDSSTGYPKAKIGRAKGSSGLTKEHRELAAQRAEAALAEEREEQAHDTITWLLQNADGAHAGALETKTLAKLQAACQTMSGFCGRVIESRK